ncbi:MAG: DUF2007 domain-containing protein [Balneolaceae bacterium]|jgi:hypothetical protein|nr:DUF2007 domain-containing protein [Balneolaceae bacterium]
MFTNPKPNAIQDWTCILESTQEFEVNLAHNFLTDQDVPSQILSKRDTAYSLVVGEMALMYLYVPNEYAEQAIDLLESIPEASLDDAFEDEQLDDESDPTKKVADHSNQTDLENE